MFSTQELQARKQIWWACSRADMYVELEFIYTCPGVNLTGEIRYTAIYMGRPPSILERDFDTPLPEVILCRIVFMYLICAVADIG